jgi:hypothetical protein
LFKENDASKWYIGNEASTDSLRFYDGTANAERMRIDSSGNLLVGTTATTHQTGSSTQALTYLNNGYFAVSRSSNDVAFFNRQVTDGNIITLRKDGTNVGSIASRSGVVTTFILDPRTATNGGAGISATGEAAQPAILPTNQSTVVNNNTDLGSSFYRWKDLYLAGGLYVGGTGTANKLDDYEEGTFTPTIEGSSTAGTATYSKQLGKYTKVGNKVTIQLQVNWSAGTGSGTAMYVKGLPFTNNTTFIQALTIGFINGVTLASNTYAHANIANGHNFIRLFDEVVGGGATGDVGYDSGGEISIGGTYLID